MQYYKIGKFTFSIGFREDVPKTEHYSKFEMQNISECHLRINVSQVDAAFSERVKSGKLIYDDAHRQIYTLEGKQYFINPVHEDFIITKIPTNDEISAVKVYVSSFSVFEKYYRYHLMPLYWLFIPFGGLLLHGSCVNSSGDGIIFSAPSGTGKSTQAELWRVHNNAEIINGDRSLIYFEDGDWKVSGSPWCGSSGIVTNTAVPIKAVVVIRQGSGNKISRLKPGEAYRYVLSELSVPHWNYDLANGVLDILQGLIAEVPVYYFECLADRSAVCELEKILTLS